MSLNRYEHKNYLYNFSIIFLGLLLCFVLCSCGLESYYDIPPPRNAVQQNPADGSTDDDFVDSPEYQLFEFTAGNFTGDFIFPGTNVYYRIYNNIDDLQSDAEQINNANTENTSNGFTKLESLRYLSMSSDTSAIPLINGNGGRVIIRLVTDTSEIYPNGIFVGGSETAIPLRYDGGRFNFDPETSEDIPNTLPVGGDNDYNDGTNDGNSYWYVNAYAVSTGMNSTTFTPISSEVLSLGFIAYTSK